MHVIDIAHELNVALPERVLDPEFLMTERQRILDVLTPRISLAADRPLTIEWGTIQPMKEELALRLTYRILNEHPGSLAIDTNLFPHDPIHQTFINVYEARRSPPAGHFQRNHRAAHLLAYNQGAIAVIKTFIPSGTHHILIDPIRSCS